MRQRELYFNYKYGTPTTSQWINGGVTVATLGAGAVTGTAARAGYAGFTSRGIAAKSAATVW